MTNEQAIDIIEKMCFKVAVNSPAQDALTMADMALQNQEKYENALELAVRDSDKSGTDVWCEDCGYEEDERLNKCWECGMKYYKHKVGLEDN